MIDAEQMKDIAQMMDRIADAAAESNYFIYGAETSIVIALAEEPVGEILLTDNGLQFATR